MWINQSTFPQMPWQTRIIVGVWLAREGVGTFNIFIARHSAFASKPAPTGYVSFTALMATPITVGAWLAREGVGTFNIFIARHSAFASKPAPTGLRGVHKTQVQPHDEIVIPPSPWRYPQLATM